MIELLQNVYTSTSAFLFTNTKDTLWHTLGLDLLFEKIGLFFSWVMAGFSLEPPETQTITTITPTNEVEEKIENIAGLALTKEPYFYDTILHSLIATHETTLALKVLESAEIAINGIEGKETTPLQLAALNGNNAILSRLLEKGADINKMTKKSPFTPLHAACVKGYTRVVQTLIERQADINTLNKEHWTPLNAASFQGFTDIVQILLDNKADTTIPNTKGQTPLDSAKRKNHTKIIELLTPQKTTLPKSHSSTALKTSKPSI